MAIQQVSGSVTEGVFLIPISGFLFLPSSAPIVRKDVWTIFEEVAEADVCSVKGSLAFRALALKSKGALSPGESPDSYLRVGVGEKSVISTSGLPALFGNVSTEYRS
ncbi:uncharacterized protein VTP21DRAFT_9649 [Calcarisporiella thermophila]|uniref:uncharacterized protein n=1 Tax=Calcarisporiella thermophila TaxID=911321 RepID=UPI0037438F1F